MSMQIFTLFDVSNREIIPLCVVKCIEIEVKIEVVLEIAYFLYFSQVTRLEARVEKEC